LRHYAEESTRSSLSQYNSRFEIMDNLLVFNEPTRPARICVPDDWARRVFKFVHGVQGHPGHTRTHQMLRQVSVWSDINKGLQREPGTLQPRVTPTQPFEAITMDFLALPGTRDGSDQLTVVVDTLSKFVFLIPSRKSDDAEAMALSLWDRVFSVVGLRYPDQ
jgi:hypothetical protein